LPRQAERELPTRARFATPEATIRTFAAALESARLGVAMECFTEQACLLTPDATAVNGRGAIGDILAQLIGQRVRIAIENFGTLVAGETALVNQRWQMRSGGSDNPHCQVAVPILVLRRVGKEWKLVIAAPWGRPDGRG